MTKQKISFLLLCGMASLVIVLGNTALTRPGSDQGKPRPKINLAVGGQILHLDQGYLFRTNSPTRSEKDQITLIAQFPDLRPFTQFTTDKEARQRRVLITLKPMDESRGEIAPEDRPSRLYARYLKPATGGLEKGLLQRHFEPGSPYQSEDLFLSPPDGRAFYARCSRPNPQADVIEESCFTEMRHAGLEIRILFAPDMLGQWSLLTDGVRALLNKALKDGANAARAQTG